MVIKKKITTWLLFASLVIFPFGQLPKLFLGLHLFDLVNFLLLISLFFSAKFNFLKSKPYIAFMFTAAFSLLLSRHIEFISLLYLLRLANYLFLCVFLRSFVQDNPFYKRTLIQSLIIISICVSILGLLQYFWLPDLRSLKYLGWDDHYFRLLSTFLDPAFTGIVIVLGSICLLYLKKYKLFLLLVFALSLTYSRASYLSFFVAFVYLISFKRLNRSYLASFLIVFLSVLVMTRNIGGEGVNLLRTTSIINKFDNYEHSLSIIKEYPLFGVGYNNICQYNISHNNACSGLDNSYLFVFATTGILGLMTFINLALSIINNVDEKYKRLIYPSLLAIFVHSQFTNTIFYAWVMYWIAILIAVSYKDSSRV